MTISLAKGQRISLSKEAGAPLRNVIMGLSWDMAEITTRGFFGTKKEKVAIDLDASCLLFDASGQLSDTVWFRQLASRCGSIRHSGDNRTGEGEGDDEQITVDLTRVPPGIKTLIFTVNSFTGESFKDIPNAACRLLNGSDGKEIARFDLSVQGAHTAQIMTRLYRHEDGWRMHAIGENAHGRTFREMLPQIAAYL